MVIGVVNAIIEDADNVGFAIRVDALIRLLRRENIEFRGAGAMTPVRTCAPSVSRQTGTLLRSWM